MLAHEMKDLVVGDELAGDMRLVVVFLTGTDEAAQTFQLGADLSRVYVLADRNIGGRSSIDAEVLFELFKCEQRDAELRR